MKRRLVTYYLMYSTPFGVEIARIKAASYPQAVRELRRYIKTGEVQQVSAGVYHEAKRLVENQIPF